MSGWAGLPERGSDTYSRPLVSYNASKVQGLLLMDHVLVFLSGLVRTALSSFFRI